MDIQNKDDKLAYVAERFIYHSKKAQTSDNPIIVDAAKKMCSIERNMGNVGINTGVNENGRM